jgi:hypothetical protein
MLLETANISFVKRKILQKYTSKKQPSIFKLLIRNVRGDLYYPAVNCKAFAAEMMRQAIARAGQPRLRLQVGAEISLTSCQDRLCDQPILMITEQKGLILRHESDMGVKLTIHLHPLPKI